VEAAPTTVEAPLSAAPPPRRSSAAAPREVDTLYDQRFLDQMRSLGYVIVNPQLALRNAHEACRLFRLGESAEQVNQQMSAQMGANTIRTAAHELPHSVEWIDMANDSNCQPRSFMQFRVCGCR